MSVSLAHRRQVAATALSLPPMGFGAAHLGGMFTRVPGDLARATMQAAWDGGIRYFDTAPFYGLASASIGPVISFSIRCVTSLR